jgi:hypothetical protein
VGASEVNASSESRRDAVKAKVEALGRDDQWAYVRLAKSYAQNNDFDSARLVYEAMANQAADGSWMRSMALNGLACCDLQMVQRNFTTSSMPKGLREHVVVWGPLQDVNRQGKRYTRRHPYRGQTKKS